MFWRSYCYASNTAQAQTRASGSPIDGLDITWRNITNNYQGKVQSRQALVFTTTPKFHLPATGWKIYFNYARQIVPNSLTSGLQVQHINGYFFCLSPTSEFKGIGSGQSVTMEFTSSEWVINISDAPAGFYLVWDNQPAKTFPLPNFHAEQSARPEQLMRSPQDKIEAATAASIYEQNKLIEDIPADKLSKVFPTPVSYKEFLGSFILKSTVRLESSTLFNNEKTYLRQILNSLLIPEKLTGRSARQIILQQKSMAAEAYELEISTNHIVIDAADAAGIFYGIQSLKTLIDPEAYRRKQKSIAIKNVTVSDQPRFAYRAFMLDVARNFKPKQEIIKLLDVMSLYKLNILHLHLTDDEGWRLEIPELPELTIVGAKRGHTLTNAHHLQPAMGSGPDISNKQGSGYYTKADFIEILKYATQRHIRIIPEIESPGHARAAIKSMDARYKHYLNLGQKAEAEKYLLRDFNDTSKYSSVQLYNDNVIDVSLPSTYAFISKITTSVVQMYKEAGAPLQTIHFGGDEVPAGAWQNSPAFYQLMKTDTAIHSTNDLWLHYYTRVNDILKSNGLYLTAWEEVGLVKTIQNKQKVNVLNKMLLNKNIHLEVWNNVIGSGAEDLAYKQANAGYKVILSCVSNLYFDMASEKSFNEPGYYWSSYVDVDKVFKFIPFNYFKNISEDQLGKALNPIDINIKEKLGEVGKANIVGLQGALFSETLKSCERMEYMLLPKLLGLAERAWASDPKWARTEDTTEAKELYNHAWSIFVNQISKRELPRLDNYAGGFNYRIPEPGAILKDKMVLMNSQLPGFSVHYTTDGSIPTAKSPIYQSPVLFSRGLKMVLFNANGRNGRVINF